MAGWSLRLLTRTILDSARVGIHWLRVDTGDASSNSLGQGSGWLPASTLRGQERHAPATQTGWGLWAVWRVSRSPEPACTSSHHTAPCLLRAPLSNLLTVLSVPGQDTNSWSSRKRILQFAHHLPVRAPPLGAERPGENTAAEDGGWARFPKFSPRTSSMSQPRPPPGTPHPGPEPVTFTQGTLSKKSVIGQGYGMQQEAAAENVAPRPAAPLEQYP